MAHKIGIIERAYQLASSGSCRTVEEIRRSLKGEAYESVDAHTSGLSLKRELQARMRIAKTAR